MIFEKVKKNLGFGCMRLLMKDGEIDYGEFNKMIDAFMDAGFNYFDTAHGYIDQKSEIAIRDCLASRYRREEFVLTNKLSEWYIKREEDIIPFFENQLKRCGVDYFDFYLCHAVDRENYPKYRDCNAFEIIKKLKKQGKVKHMAISFHDTADVLDMILTEQPDIEAVQLQINYLDYDDPAVQSKACCDVAVKHGKDIIVMEPVKGGRLANLPEKAAVLLKDLPYSGSQASFALRYAASCSGVFMVLSGMGNMAMMQDNINTMKNFVPLNDLELKAASCVRGIIREVSQIQCTGCNYCTEECPKSISIPQIFSVYNEVLAAKSTCDDAKSKLPENGGKASECIKCGKCEARCPQNIKIREQLEKIAKRFND